jgi:hypothetical protein
MRFVYASASDRSRVQPTARRVVTPIDVLGSSVSLELIEYGAI